MPDLRRHLRASAAHHLRPRPLPGVKLPPILVKGIGAEVGGGALATSDGPGIHGGGGGSSSNPFMGVGSRLAMLETSYTPADANHLYLTGEIVIYSPDYDCYDVRFCFPGWLLTVTNTSPEVDCPNAFTAGAIARVSGTDYPISFAGVNSHTAALAVQPGSNNWCDMIRTNGARVVIPARTPIHLLVEAGVPNTSLQFPIGAQLATQSQNGENASFSSASQIGGIFGGGTISGANSAGCYGPTMMVCRGTDGRAHIIGIGDSAYTSADTAQDVINARGMEGHVRRGFDDDSSSTLRLPITNLNMNGTSQQSRTGYAVSGNFLRTGQMLACPQDVNPTDWVIANYWLNQHTANGSGSTAAVLQASLKALYVTLRQAFNLPIVQTTCTPKTVEAGNSGFTDPTSSGQTTQADLTSDRMVTNAFMQTNDGLAFLGIAGVIDVCGQCVDPTTKDTWAAGIYSSTLAAGVSPGASTITLTAAPPIGALLTIHPGNSDRELTGGVKSVSGTGPYVCGLDFQIAGTWTSTTVVKDRTTLDGVHLSSWRHQQLVSLYRAAKLAGVFGPRAVVNNAPTGIGLAQNQVQVIAKVGDQVGVLSTVDPDAKNTFTYSIVSITASKKSLVQALVRRGRLF